jgi:hypothetical protein
VDSLDNEYMPDLDHEYILRDIIKETNRTTDRIIELCESCYPNSNELIILLQRSKMLADRRERLGILYKGPTGYDVVGNKALYPDNRVLAELQKLDYQMRCPEKGLNAIDRAFKLEFKSALVREIEKRGLKVPARISKLPEDSLSDISVEDNLPRPLDNDYTEENIMKETNNDAKESSMNNFIKGLKTGLNKGVQQAATDTAGEVLVDLVGKILGKEHFLLQDERGRELSKVIGAAVLSYAASTFLPNTDIPYLNEATSIQTQTAVLRLVGPHMKDLITAAQALVLTTKKND